VSIDRTEHFSIFSFNYDYDLIKSAFSSFQYYSSNLFKKKYDQSGPYDLYRFFCGIKIKRR